IEHFGAGESRVPAVVRTLKILAEVGLGYISLGQPLTTLSGGERQRLKLAVHLSAKAADAAQVIILDEPTTGLHLADVGNLLRLFGGPVGSRRAGNRNGPPQAGDAPGGQHLDSGPGAGHGGGSNRLEGRPAPLVTRAKANRSGTAK